MKITSILAGIAVSLLLQLVGNAQYIITKGGVYTISPGEPIEIETTEAVTLKNCYDTCSTTPIVTAMAGAQVTLYQNYFAYSGSIPQGGWTAPSQGMLYFPQPAGVIVQNNVIEGGSGIGAEGVTIEGPSSGEIYITQNAIDNCWEAIQVAKVKNDPEIYITWNQITGDAATNHSDQLSIYETTGVSPNNYVYLYENFVEQNPDVSNSYPYSGGIVIDVNSQYVLIDSCYVINGGEYGINGGPTGGSSVVENCEALGLSYLTCEEGGGGIQMCEGGGGFQIYEDDAAYVNDVSGFWNTVGGVIDDFAPSLYGQGKNLTRLKKSQITLQGEEDLYYTTWYGAVTAAGLTIGWQGIPSPTFPNPQDFDF
jgi:hypothetical protein